MYKQKIARRLLGRYSKGGIVQDEDRPFLEELGVYFGYHQKENAFVDTAKLNNLNFRMLKKNSRGQVRKFLDNFFQFA